MQEQGKGVAVVAGASGGLGHAVVERLASQGYRVRAVGRDLERLAALEADNVVLVQADVSTEEGAAAAIGDEQDNMPNSLVNCAGQVFVRSLHATTEEAYRDCLSANLDTSFFLLKAFVGSLRKAKTPGAAVLVSTVAAKIGIQNHEAVSAAKAAVDGLVRSAAATYSAQGLRVNAVAPGLMETDAVAGFLRGDASREAMARQYPLGRFGQPEEAAGLIAWLLSSEAAWVTGQSLSVDGGFTAVRPTVKP